MKKLLLIISISALIWGCGEKPQIEEIRDYNKIYHPEYTLSVKPEFIVKPSGELKDKLLNQLGVQEGKYTFQIFMSLYINEAGKVDKVRFGENTGEKTKSIIISDMENWRFSPGIINGEKVKCRLNYPYIFSVNKKFKNQSNEALIDEQTFFVAVEEMPSPIGGIAGIQKKIHYPEIAKQAGIQGRVFVKAFIDEKGNVAKTELIKGIGAGCDEEALKAVKETKFTPGRQRGKAVKVQVSVPILFKLSDIVKDSTRTSRAERRGKTGISGKHSGGILCGFGGEMPQPIGGVKAIIQRVKYPEKAKKAGVQGRVFVKAVIDKNGDVAETEILKGIDSECDKAAAEAVKKSKFIPAKTRDGKIIDMRVTIPILFKLDDSEKEAGNSGWQSFRNLKVLINGDFKGKVLLKGKIFDDKTNTPLSGASIYLAGTKLGCASNEKGEFFLKNIPAGKYKIKASYPGKSAAESETIGFKQNTAIKLDVYLRGE